jgi:hypothetical protein
VISSPLRRAALSADFLVLAEDQVDRLARLEAGPGEALDRLHDRHQVALVVPRPAPPDEAVLHGAGERRLLPVGLGARGDRDDVLVGHQGNRRRGRVRARPGVEKPVLADRLAPQHGVRPGEVGHQQGVQGVEFGRMGVLVLARGDGLQAHRSREPGGRRRGVDGHRRDRRHAQLAR